MKWTPITKPKYYKAPTENQLNVKHFPEESRWFYIGYLIAKYQIVHKNDFLLK